MSDMKARNWMAVVYPENMIDEWETEIYDILELPFAYCIHDCDYENGEQKKTHVHLILQYSNTTTKSSALSLINELSKDNSICCSTIKPIRSMFNAYNYLIHNTETAIRQGKFLYDEFLRVCGNGFDISGYVDNGFLNTKMCKELADVIICNRFSNFSIFYAYVINNFDSSYFEVLRCNSGFLERLCKGFRTYNDDIKDYDINS